MARPGWERDEARDDGIGWCGTAPPNGFLAESWFVRARWERDGCPCCGGDLGEYKGEDCGGPDGGTGGGPHEAIAEGVLICGVCSTAGCLAEGWAARSLLKAIAAGATEEARRAAGLGSGLA